MGSVHSTGNSASVRSLSIPVHMRTRWLYTGVVSITLHAGTSSFPEKEEVESITHGIGIFSLASSTPTKHSSIQLHEGWPNIHPKYCNLLSPHSHDNRELSSGIMQLQAISCQNLSCLLARQPDHSAII